MSNYVIPDKNLLAKFRQLRKDEKVRCSMFIEANYGSYSRVVFENMVTDNPVMQEHPSFDPVPTSRKVR